MTTSIKYELLELERLIASKHSELINNGSLDQLRTEIERIKQTFIDEVFHIDDERRLERYIQYHQQALIHLMDICDAALREGSKTKLFHEEVHKSVDHLLLFIERHFTKYFDQDAKAPDGYLMLARKDARSSSGKLAKGLQEKGGDPVLINLVLRILQRVADGSSPKANTYRRIMYGKEMQSFSEF